MWSSGLAIPRCGRRIGVPRWAVAVTAVWLGGVWLASWLSRLVESPPSLCLFHRVTGLPCPTCGTTRMVLALGQGRPVDALLLNPLTFAALMLAVIWLVLRLGFGRRWSPGFGAIGRRRAWIVVTVVFLSNWAYLIWREFV
ncbi:MAG: DUF2752 domain-containing protein [Phycisphaerales bacterium]|nr:MAG: DUF2752 domain-containing protein [Phycisphaerales bacterium]